MEDRPNIQEKKEREETDVSEIYKKLLVSILLYHLASTYIFFHNFGILS